MEVLDAARQFAVEVWRAAAYPFQPSKALSEFLDIVRSLDGSASSAAQNEHRARIVHAALRFCPALAEELPRRRGMLELASTLNDAVSAHQAALERELDREARRWPVPDHLGEAAKAALGVIDRARVAQRRLRIRAKWDDCSDLPSEAVTQVNVVMFSALDRFTPPGHIIHEGLRHHREQVPDPCRPHHQKVLPGYLDALRAGIEDGSIQVTEPPPLPSPKGAYLGSALDARQRVLNSLIDEVDASATYPIRQKFKVQHKRDHQVVEDLFRDGFIFRNLGTERFCRPTLAGLANSTGPGRDRLVAEAQQVLSCLRGLFEGSNCDETRSWTMDELAASTGLEVERVRIAAQFVAETSAGGGGAVVDGTTLLKDLRAQFKLLDIESMERELHEVRQHRPLSVRVGGLLIDPPTTAPVKPAFSAASADLAPAAPTLDELRTKLAFLKADGRLRPIIERDLTSLGLVMQAKCWKSAMLLAGSILEGVLLDVLERRSDIAASCMPRNRAWPSAASLADLIAIAGRSGLPGEGRQLLTETSCASGKALKDHRDLIHPQAELSSGITVDQASTEMMLSLLKCVVRDLHAAHERSDIQAYTNQ